jgi:hypothetical protein
LRSPELHPNAENATPEELRVAMDAAPNKRSYVRLSAMRALLLGYSRQEVCELNDRTDRMVRLWIERFNRGGIDALITRPKPGRPRKVKLNACGICSCPCWKILRRPAKCTGPA